MSAIAKNLRQSLRIAWNRLMVIAHHDVILEPGAVVKFWRSLSIGRHCTIQANTYVYGSRAGNAVSLGDHVVVSPGCMLLGEAGLSIGDLEDLRIAVDELAYALIGDERSGAPLTLRFLAADGVVEIEGTCAANGCAPELGDLARTIVKVIADEHEIEDDGDTRRFRLVKRSRD